MVNSLYVTHGSLLLSQLVILKISRKTQLGKVNTLLLTPHFMLFALRFIWHVPLFLLSNDP
jgi:hypothetical protein